MILNSFTQDSTGLVPIEVELTLWPGLPTIQILGLPDQHIKESAMRIKSAIKSQGFHFPRSQQILVNLRPNHLKKNSRGVELAVAVAYLLETEQITLTEEQKKNLFVYGELNLSGEVFAPDAINFSVSDEKNNGKFLTGVMKTPLLYYGLSSKAEITTLSSLSRKITFEECKSNTLYQRPQLLNQTKWTTEQAELLALIAAGEHHALMVGSGGAGKTTMATAVHQLMQAPTSGSGIFSSWRPLARPHHKTPAISLIGGGPQATAGEITRAHGGLLIMDEFLEFDSSALESLREPIEEGVIRIARGKHSHTLPADFQLVATSNLCPCGGWSPGQLVAAKVCRFTKRKCRSYSERFSGPLLDRFHLVAFVDKGSEARSVSTLQILDRVERAQGFRQQQGREVTNGRLSVTELENMLRWDAIPHLLPEFEQSQRRRIAMIRVARTLADLEQEVQILPRHLRKSMEWTVTNFHRLSRWET